MRNGLSQLTSGRTAADRLRTLAGPRPTRYSARQSEILDHLEAVILEEGFRSLTIGELSKRVRCSTRTLYELASTREELLLLVLSRMWERMGNEVRLAMEEADGVAAKLKAFVQTGVGILWPPYSILMDDIAAYAPASQLFEQHINTAIGLISDLVAEGVQTGAFRPVDPDLMAAFIASGTIGATRQPVLDGVHLTPVAAVDQLMDLLLTGQTN